MWFIFEGMSLNLQKISFSRIHFCDKFFSILANQEPHAIPFETLNRLTKMKHFYQKLDHFHNKKNFWNGSFGIFQNLFCCSNHSLRDRLNFLFSYFHIFPTRTHAAHENVCHVHCKRYIKGRKEKIFLNIRVRCSFDWFVEKLEKHRLCLIYFNNSSLHRFGNQWSKIFPFCNFLEEFISEKTKTNN